ncbi:MAG: DUF5063 domain-containing protein [Bacteroidales bacterium]|nr:DUF5063 domain-containing protein [Bacteroidales bacterium]
MTSSEPVYSQTALDMFTVANEYCIFMEKACKYQKTDVYNYLLKVFPLLYIKGALMPQIEVEFPEANERYVTEEQWQIVFNELRELFGEDDLFNHCDPKDEFFEPVKLSLAENLADIYQDMKDFVLLYSKEMHAARENAIHEVGRLFKSHWGHRVLRCQTHLHFLLHRRDIESEEVY